MSDEPFSYGDEGGIVEGHDPRSDAESEVAANGDDVHESPDDMRADVDDVDDAPSELLVPLGDVLAELEKRTREVTTRAAEELLPTTRTPPNAVDAERALLGGLLIEPSAFERVVDEALRPDDFYRRAHGVVFKVIQDLTNAAEPVDTLTVVDELMRRGQLETVGGAAAVAQLEALIPTAAHVGAYARLIKEKSTLRRLIESATLIVEAGFRQDRRVTDIIDEAERAILAISESTAKRGMVPMSELVRRATEQLTKAVENKSAITGVPSGFRDLDHLTSGFQPGELIIVAARPSMGKTAFTLNLAAHAAMRARVPVGFFSLEMGADQLVQRLIGAEARIDISALRRGFIQRHEWTKLAQAAGELAEAPVYIDETPGLSVSEMRTKARRLKHESNIGMVIVDYLQLMSGPPGMDNKATEVGEISKGLKQLARELNIPVIALSQLNRGVESRTDKRPMMSDLRESGAIEQDADVIAFLYREEYYLRDKTPEDKIGIAEIIIGKHRNGPTGSVDLRFFNSITRFENLAKDEGYAP
jgi:replicative DNA helicase